MSAAYLVCGVAGLELDGVERRTLESLGPSGVILFGRNIASAAQVRDLTAALRDLPSRPRVAVDLEGGRVNRLREVIGELPSPATAAATGLAGARALGEACGAACAFLGIDVDYAPVVDVARKGGYLKEEDRCLGATPATVEALAEAFLDGLERFGVAGCLKHYPGLGSGTVDSHADLAELDEAVVEDRRPFASLAAPDRAVMVAHAIAPALGDGVRAASLSPAVVAGLRELSTGPVVADDLEMGALEAFGSIPERAAAALLAGCDQVLVCNGLEVRTAVVDHIDRWTDRSVELRVAVMKAAERVARFTRRPLTAVDWDEVAGRIARCRELAGEPA